MPAILNPHGVETEADDWLIRKMKKDGDWARGFQALPVKREGSGPAKQICLLLGNNGIGDDIHAMPAIAQKLADGYSIDVYSREFTRVCYESLGCTFYPASSASMGFYEGALTKYGAIYHLSQWCIDHESKTDGKPTLSRFEQFAALLDTELPAAFDWSKYLVGDDAMPCGHIVIAMHASAIQRSYPLALSLYKQLDTWKRFTFVKLGETKAEYKATSFRELITLIDTAALVVSVDTGPLQIALALGTPSVAVFGGSVADVIVKQYERYVSTPYRVVQSLKKDRRCARPCSFNNANGYHKGGKCKTVADCMTEITPHEIQKAMRELLNTTETVLR